MPKKPKKDANDKAPVPQPSPKRLNSSTPRPKPTPPVDDDLNPPPPEGEYQEYRLMSSALNGWKYDVMKFHSTRPVDVSTWAQPVKLNRKDVTVSVAAPAQKPVGPMLGADGKPVIGADGKVVMVDADGRPIHNLGETSATGSGKDENKGANSGRKKPARKTRQVYLVPDEVRKLRKEERYPWVMEDGTGNEVWTGSMEEASKAENYAFFMPAENNIFKFVPSHRWYKFEKKRNLGVRSLDEAEQIMAKIAKNKEPERWLFHRTGRGASSSTSAMFKGEPDSNLPGSSSLVYNVGHSLGPNGRALRTVDTGMGHLFGDDDEEGMDTKRRKEREYGGEGDMDEVEFEEEFADDEEKMEPEDNDDEEAKEMEERIKREYRKANKLEGGEEEEDDEDESKLTTAGKAMKKIIKNLEKNNAYDSDDEENPYASEEEEEEEEPQEVPTGPAVQQQQQRPPSRSQTPSHATSTPSNKPPPSAPSSRATSPVPPGHGGHSVVALRATSPKAPKPKTGGKSPTVSRAGSPLAPSPPAGGGGGSRATSPVGSLAGSPPVQSPTIPGVSKPSAKRKATDELGPASPTSPSAPSSVPKPKKRKPIPPAVPSATGGILDDRMVIEWLRNTPHATTRDCIQHFTPYLTDETKKAKFTGLVKEVAQLRSGVLVLRNQYRSDGGVSPGATTSGS
ncbi:hypothetical protein JAAARDRAFT_118109 [Jaapia argillacea MUCL 33604]|uniref:Transcription initiation factor IIF subunit alpha n=1 Tax=Jaapia argillacea MUCL 33604 TaxID=933084 RepID=A0A067QPF7_9AGAM|nr:hypothetical protein JAAARDRAFT_118109 [Jaapia argillacea MUCL 33604]